MENSCDVPDLSTWGCRTRQKQLAEVLAELNLDAALICNRNHVYYFTGYWCRSLFTPVVLIRNDGAVLASIPASPPCEMTADVVLLYEATRLGTLVDDQWLAALEPLQTPLTASKSLGCDGLLPIGRFGGESCRNISSEILNLRRKKGEDELQVIAFAVAATEAAYQCAFDLLSPGITEVELFAAMQAAVAEFIGEQVTDFGNDFQIGSKGGPPRRRAAVAGEIAVLDLSVVVRGYRSDLCRSFAVGHKPTDLQLSASQRIAEVFAHIEKSLVPKARCRDLYATVNDMLEGHRGWTFGHHLGHGIGLAAHESPRFNPHWDDTLQIGDVFTIEPGLYGDDLRAGIRIEQDYYLADDGLKRLSSFPVSLA